MCLVMKIKNHHRFCHVMCFEYVCVRLQVRNKENDKKLLNIFLNKQNILEEKLFSLKRAVLSIRMNRLSCHKQDFN